MGRRGAHPPGSGRTSKPWQELVLGAYCVLGPGTYREHNCAHFIDGETEAREGRSLSQGHTSRTWKSLD